MNRARTICSVDQGTDSSCKNRTQLIPFLQKSNGAAKAPYGSHRLRSVKTDVFDWLASPVASPQSFDLIILDPPSLARRESEREQAIRPGPAIRRGSPALLISDPHIPTPLPSVNRRIGVVVSSARRTHLTPIRQSRARRTDRKLLLWHRITLAPGGLRGDGKFRRIPYRPPVLAASSSQNAICFLS